LLCKTASSSEDKRLIRERCWQRKVRRTDNSKPAAGSRFNCIRSRAVAGAGEITFRSNGLESHRSITVDSRHLRPTRSVKRGKIQVELAQLKYLLPG
jgi:hypothetical protein